MGVLALVAALAACGSSSKASSTASSTGTSTSAGQSNTGSTPTGATGAPIKVGVICSCTGAYSAYDTPLLEVYRSWVDTANASGGIDGHAIQLVVKDDALNPGTSTIAIQALLADHLDALVDISLVDTVWAPMVQKANIPVVGGAFDAELFETNPDWYAPGGTANSFNYGYISILKAGGFTQYGVVYCAEAPACAQYVQQIKPLAKQAGISQAYAASISETAPNYTAQCVAAQQQHIKVMIVEDVAATIARFAKDCATQGYNPTYITGGTSFEQPWETTPGLKDGLVTPYEMLPYWVNTPATQAMNTAVDKYYPGLRSNVNVWNESVVLGWPSGVLLGDAIKAGGLQPSDTPTPAEIIKGLTSLKGDTLDGWSPPLTFTAGQPHPMDCWFTGQLQNGVPSLVNNGKVTCHSDSSS